MTRLLRPLPRFPLDDWLPLGLLALVLSFGSSVSLALVRISRGAELFELLGILGVVGLSLLSLLVLEVVLEQGLGGPNALSSGCAHLIGIALAVGAVHVSLLFFRRVLPVPLVEQPGQLVNDLVLAMSVLAMVWALRVRPGMPRAVLLFGAFGLVAGYQVSRSLWHLDPFPGQVVQQFVVTAVVAVALALLLFDVLRSSDQES